eukprot:m.191321 g.191321  ORF g.191321 m.191321 type:complete len:305 (+) comp10047_c0_seq1:1379-2293(+)
MPVIVFCGDRLRSGGSSRCSGGLFKFLASGLRFSVCPGHLHLLRRYCRRRRCRIKSAAHLLLGVEGPDSGQVGEFLSEHRFHVWWKRDVLVERSEYLGSTNRCLELLRTRERNRRCARALNPFHLSHHFRHNFRLEGRLEGRLDGRNPFSKTVKNNILHFADECLTHTTAIWADLGCFSREGGETSSRRVARRCGFRTLGLDDGALHSCHDVSQDERRGRDVSRTGSPLLFKFELLVLITLRSGFLPRLLGSKRGQAVALAVGEAHGSLNLLVRERRDTSVEVLELLLHGLDLGFQFHFRCRNT